MLKFFFTGLSARNAHVPESLLTTTRPTVIWLLSTFLAFAEVESRSLVPCGAPRVLDTFDTLTLADYRATALHLASS